MFSVLKEKKKISAKVANQTAKGNEACKVILRWH